MMIILLIIIIVIIIMIMIMIMMCIYIYIYIERERHYCRLRRSMSERLVVSSCVVLLVDLLSLAPRAACVVQLEIMI